LGEKPVPPSDKGGGGGKPRRRSINVKRDVTKVASLFCWKSFSGREVYADKRSAIGKPRRRSIDGERVSTMLRPFFYGLKQILYL